MKYDDMTKEQLIEELNKLRQEVSSLRVGNRGTTRPLNKSRKIRFGEVEIEYNQLTSILDAIPFGIAIATKQTGPKVWYNQKASRFLGIDCWGSLSDFNIPTSRLNFFRNGKKLNLNETPIHDAIFDGKGIKDDELEVRFEDGTSKFLLGNTCLLYLDSCNVEGVILAFKDMTRQKLMEQKIKNLNDNLEKIVKQRTEQLNKEISKRKQMDQSLRESEKRFRVALKDSPVVVFNQDLNLRYTLVYNSFMNIPAEVAIGKGESEFFSPEDSGFLEKIKRQVMQSGVGFQKEVKLTTVEGVTKYFDLKIEPTYDSNERISGITGAALDITSHKKSEEALRESEERYRKLIELSPDTIAVHSGEKTIFINKTGLKLFDAKSSNEIIGKSVLQFVHPDSVTDVEEKINQMYAAGEPIPPFEHKLIGLQGQIIDAEVTAVPLDDDFKLHDIECLVCGTSTPDQLLPNHALMTQGELKLTNIEAVATSGICLSGVTALNYGYLSVISGTRNNAVVTASDVSSLLMLSKNFDKESETKLEDLKKNGLIAFDKDFLRWMLSDGAGAMLLENNPNKNGISLKIKWIEIISYAGEMPVCMYCGGKKGGDKFKGWKEFDSIVDVVKESLFTLSQDIKVLNPNIMLYTVKKPLSKLT